MIKKIAKEIAKNINTSYLERILSQSILKKKYNELFNTKIFKTREELWTSALEPFKNDEINFIEFGVWEGYSLDIFSKLNKSNNSSFYGFDSFEGLPSDWDETYKKGSFNVDGLIPGIKDKRVTFQKGWFQNTLPDFLKSFKEKNFLFVHYDADLYSSTLYCLSQIDSLKLSYIAIFDEFYSHEMRALSNYQDAYGANIEFIGKTISDNYPVQVSCKITPCEVYKV